MALPVNVGYGTVTGRFLLAKADGNDSGTEPEGVPAKGYVIFTASPNKLLDTEALDGSTPAPVTILPMPVISELDTSGYICGYGTNRGVKLIATNDPHINPYSEQEDEQWTWRVDFRLTDDTDAPYPVSSFSFSLPEDEVVDLTDVTPIPSADGTYVTQGPQGDTGPAGPANTLTVSGTTTGNAGTNASVTISGTAPTQSLAFTIPRGDKGNTGDTGPEGPQGDPGADAVWNFIGTYDNGADYEIGDLVTYLGSTYYRLLGPNPGYPPTDPTYWKLIAAKGDQGDEGPEGPEGPTGPAGASIVVKGQVATVGDLPATGNTVNDAWIVTADTHLYIWNGTTWIDAGDVQGPPGEGVPTGGAANTFLKKVSSTDYDTAWSNTIDGGTA